MVACLDIYSDMAYNDYSTKKKDLYLFMSILFFKFIFYNH